ILKEPLGKKDVHLPRAKSHHDDWIDSIRSRKDPIANVEVGARSVTVCHLGNLAYWYRQTLYWDPDAWDLINKAEDQGAMAGPAEGAAMSSAMARGVPRPIPLDRERRDPWQLPEI